MSELGFQVTRIGASERMFAAALHWELQLFGVANAYASSLDLEAGRMTWYAPYDAASEFYVARDARGELAGLTRLIRYDAGRGLHSFSTIADAEGYSARGEPARSYLDPGWREALRQLPPQAIAELATQAIAPRYRRFRAMDALWRAMIEVCRNDGVEHWTVALVVPLFRFYKALLPNAIHAIGTVMPDYIGADSVPATLRLNHREVEVYLRGSDEGRTNEVSHGCDVSQAIHRASTAV